MQLASRSIGLLLALSSTTFAVQAQFPGDVNVRTQSTDHRILLHYGSFDPLLGTLEVPATLRSASDTNLWIVQFPGPATDADREALRLIGATIVQYMPYDGYIVRMSSTSAASCAVLKEVRWVGPYHPAYRVEPFLFQEHVTGAMVPLRKYNMVMADKRGQKNALQAKLQAIGGKVTDRHDGGLLMTAEMTGAQMLIAARLDEVLWIERWTEPTIDMNNARIQGGANAIETAAGYTGSGVRGHIYEGCEFNHPDFTPAMTNVRSGGEPQRHGHCTTGIVFGDGTSNANARGMAPDAVGFYTNYASVTAGWSRNMVIGDVVNVHNCMFTTASWGGGQTTAYTALSADADDIVFDHRIPWTNSMSNLGNQSVRPEAWAKNVISIGGVQHFDNSSAADDSWLAGGGSTGLAADGRIKPDLSAYYDSVWTSDLSTGVNNGEGGTASGGYNTAANPAGQSFTGFNGTSSATPICAGHNALAIQMYTDHIFNNSPRVVGGSRFQNRPFAQTLKALMITGANMYTPTATDNRREHVGWGFPNLNNLYTRRNRITIIPEDEPITQGATNTYTVNVLPGETTLKICMSYLDPQGNVAAAIDRINDLSLTVIRPDNVTYRGNVGLSGAAQANVSSSGGAANTIDTVECVFLTSPMAGNWTIQITAPVIAQDANLATAGVDATYALVVNGGSRVFGSGCSRAIPDNDPTSGSLNVIPFGSSNPAQLPSLFASNNFGNVGGAVYFDLTNTATMWLDSLDINTATAPGTAIIADVYMRTGTSVGFESSIAGWQAMTAAHGVAAAVDTPTRLDFNVPIAFFGAATRGIAVIARNFQHNYTNGTGANQNYSNADLAYAAGSASNVPFTGAPFTPRVANMTFYYRNDDSNWANQLYQTILRRDQLWGTAGSITGLAFAPDSTGRHFNRELHIQMSHVPAGYVMSTTFATNLPTPVNVMDKWDYTWHIAADTWNEIGLTTPFAYNGTSDVVVQIFARQNHNTVNAGFHRSPSQPRLFAYDFPFGSVPTTGAIDNAGQKMRVAFNCSDGQEFGTSCGRGSVDHTGSGARGTTFAYHIHNSVPSAATIIALGFGNLGQFPTSLTGSGFTNCFTFTDIVSTLFYLTDAGGFAQHSISIPNTSAYDGLKIYGQWYQLDSAQPGGLSSSPYIRLIIGLAP